MSSAVMLGSRDESLQPICATKPHYLQMGAGLNDPQAQLSYH